MVLLKHVVRSPDHERQNKTQALHDSGVGGGYDEHWGICAKGMYCINIRKLDRTIRQGWTLWLPNLDPGQPKAACNRKCYSQNLGDCSLSESMHPRVCCKMQADSTRVRSGKPGMAFDGYILSPTISQTRRSSWSWHTNIRACLSYGTSQVLGHKANRSIGQCYCGKGSWIKQGRRVCTWSSKPQTLKARSW